MYLTIIRLKSVSLLVSQTLVFLIYFIPITDLSLSLRRGCRTNGERLQLDEISIFRYTYSIVIVLVFAESSNQLLFHMLIIFNNFRLLFLFEALLSIYTISFLVYINKTCAMFLCRKYPSECLSSSLSLSVSRNIFSTVRLLSSLQRSEFAL